MNPREAADFLAGLVRTPDTRTNVERRALNILIDHARATSREREPVEDFVTFRGKLEREAAREATRDSEDSR